MEKIEIRFIVEYSNGGYLWQKVGGGEGKEYHTQEDAKKFVYGGEWEKDQKVRIIMRETIINESVLCNCFK